MKVKLELVENGRQILFAFEDGTKSPAFSSKEQACDAAIDLYKNNLIDAKEFSELVGQVMQVKDLPYDGLIEKSAIVALSMLGGLALSGGKHFLDKAKESYESFFKVPNAVRFEMCSCGCFSGYIFHRGGSTRKLVTKKTSLFIAQALKDSEQIYESEYELVKKQIIESKLPE